MRDINKGFNLMMPFIGPFMGFINEIDRLEQNQGLSENGRNTPNQSSFKNYNSTTQPRFP